MAEHILKTWPEHFQAVAEGRKKVEIRFNDRGFEVGDTLVLKEFDPTTSKFSGRETSRLVTHILSGEWLREGYVALSICEVPNDVEEQQSKWEEVLDDEGIGYIRFPEGGLDFHSEEDEKRAYELAEQNGLHLMLEGR